MSSNNSIRFERTGSPERPTFPSSPLAPQRSVSVTRRSSWDMSRNHSINSSTNRVASRLRSSFESARPFLLGPQLRVFTFPSSTELQSRGPGRNTSPSAPQQISAGPLATSQSRNQPVVGNHLLTLNTNSSTVSQSTTNHFVLPQETQPAANTPVGYLMTGNAAQRTAAQQSWEEWRSWKIGWPWLSFLLLIVLSLVSVITTLDITSRRNSGFVTQSKAPAFLAHDPAVERAIWSQGLFYTALPAFIMTIYRTMWDSTITAFAERQPYVDLRSPGGGPPESTIMLDYRSEPLLYGWVVALRKKHILLSACMFTSVILALLVIPLTSFLFTTADFVSNTTIPLSFETSFNTSILGDYRNYPDLRLPLDTAAAMHLQDASRPPWSDGEYAFPKFVPLMNIGDGTVTLNTTAYSAQGTCIYIPESQYQKTVLTPNDTGIPAVSIRISANDRGCQISNFINFRTTVGHPETFIRHWTTTSCAPYAGWSRFSILTARYTKESTGITNFSLISCAPVYQISSGTLLATVGATSVPVLKDFIPDPSNTSDSRSDDVWRFFEMGIQAPNCFDPSSNIDSNEFGRYVYKLAAKKDATSPLVPEVLIHAAQRLFATTFAVFASTILLQPMSSPLNGTGVHSMDETRLIVVSPVAYTILCVLVPVAILNIILFFYARQRSMLYEEPVGILSMSGILHKSDINSMVGRLAETHDFKGQITKTALKEHMFDQLQYVFDERERRIVSLPPPSPLPLLAP